MFQHLVEVTPKLINSMNWVTGNFGVFFGFDTVTNATNRNITINHENTGLGRTVPNGSGGIATSLLTGAGITNTGYVFTANQPTTLPVSPNSSGSDRVDLLTIFFIEKDIEPYNQISVVLLENVSEVPDARYIPLATITVPFGFTNTDQLIVIKSEYANDRKAAMKHMANSFTEANTFAVPNYGEGELISINNTVLNTAGVMVLDLSKSYYLADVSLANGIQALKNITVTNTSELITTAKNRIFHVQFNNSVAVIDSVNINTVNSHIVKGFGIATFMYNITDNDFWLIGVSESILLDDFEDGVLNNNLIETDFFSKVIHIDASTISSFSGLLFTGLTGVTKTELKGLKGYSVALVITDASAGRPVVLDNSLTSSSNSSCFVQYLRIVSPCIINCVVDANGDLLYSSTTSTESIDVTSAAVDRYPSPAFQPSSTLPITFTKLSGRRIHVSGAITVSVGTNNTSVAVIIAVVAPYKPIRSFVEAAKVVDGSSNNYTATISNNIGGGDNGLIGYNAPTVVGSSTVYIGFTYDY